MKTISEVEFRGLCRAVFDNADPSMDESYLLQQLLVLTRHKLGHSRPSTGAFDTGTNLAHTMRQEIVGLLLMRRDPFFDTNKIIDEFLNKMRN
ncbi:MAG: hypothetical protein L0229_06365 [Blastocatellia bacterium]|nr:hypothetical protein [Blastocatellia bacterium]